MYVSGVQINFVGREGVKCWGVIMGVYKKSTFRAMSRSLPCSLDALSNFDFWV